MMLATTSTRWAKLKSLVKMAFFRAGREDIQLRGSAPFSRLTMNLFIASPSKLPNTLEAVRCKHRRKRRRSKLGSQSVFDGTHCPDIRRRLPQGRLSDRWLTPSTRQAPLHPLPDPILQFLDKDCCCNGPVLPHKLFWKCLHSKCEETPTACRLPPQIQCRSSRVI